MCLLCAAAHNPFKAAAGALVAASCIELRMLCWLAMFMLSMSFMDHRRDGVAQHQPASSTG